MQNRAQSRRAPTKALDESACGLVCRGTTESVASVRFCTLLHVVTSSRSISKRRHNAVHIVSRKFCKDAQNSSGAGAFGLMCSVVTIGA